MFEIITLPLGFRSRYTEACFYQIGVYADLGVQSHLTQKFTQECKRCDYGTAVLQVITF